MTRTGGYSIIELAVTLVVMGIMVSIAIPTFSRWLPDYQLKTAATELYSNLQLAKMGAVRDNIEWALRFSPTFSLYQIWTGGPDGLTCSRINSMYPLAAWAIPSKESRLV